MSVTPSANVTRPTTRLVTVLVANQTDATYDADPNSW